MSKITKAEKKAIKQQKKLEKIEYELQKENDKREYIINNETKIREDLEKKAYYRSKNEPPKRTNLEETGNSITHGVGALCAIAAMIMLIILSNNGYQLFSAFFYGISMLLMMSMSCLYHSFKQGSRIKRIWRRFDYSSIYLLIGGTFTPMYLVFWHDIRPVLSIVFCSVQWGIILIGIIIVACLGPGRIKKLHTTLYIILGWCGILLMPDLVKHNLGLFFMVLFGGLAYTFGIIPFALKKKGAHFIWHFFVLAGALVHFLGILIFLY